MVRRMHTPLLDRRKEERRVIQRCGQADVLIDSQRKDGLSALTSFMKATLQIEFTLPHNTLWIVPPVPDLAIPGIPIPEDWGYPANPWKRE